jgi:hypothetical protein
VVQLLGCARNGNHNYQVKEQLKRCSDAVHFVTRSRPEGQKEWPWVVLMLRFSVGHRGFRLGR